MKTIPNIQFVTSRFLFLPNICSQFVCSFRVIVGLHYATHTLTPTRPHKHAALDMCQCARFIENSNTETNKHCDARRRVYRFNVEGKYAPSLAYAHTYMCTELHTHILGRAYVSLVYELQC